VGALLFVVYSHSVFAVAWLAANNTVLQTSLTLAALLCYVRASALNLYAARPKEEPDNTAWTPAPQLRRGWFAASLLLWMLAMLSRENAIVLPAILAALDLAF